MNVFARFARFSGAFFLYMPAAMAATTSPTYAEEYSNVIGRAQVQALDSDLFGERINLMNGATEFSATDVVIRTNGQIPLRFGRKLVVNNQANYGGVNNPASEILGRFWQIDVPFMRGTFPQQLGWVGSNYSTQRCSFGPPPSPVYGVGPFGNVPYENNVYWTGTTINIPGRGEEELHYLPANRPRPADGRTYIGGTKSEWRTACLPAIKNGPGEGFIAVLPDGTKYYFDWIASRSTAGLVDTYCGGGGDPFGLSCYTGVSLYRSEVFLYATKSEDRFGNLVTYTYDPNNPHRLLSIASSDGASIQIDYNGMGKISAVTTAGRTWTYAYWGDANTGVLASVGLPDGTNWTYDYSGLYDLTHIEARYLWENCEVHVGTKTSSTVPGPKETASVTMTHPSGAKGEFLFRKIIHGSNRTPGNCTMLDPFNSPNGAKFPAVGPVPSVYQLGSIYSKKITGPGLAPMNWAYTYGPTWSFDGECNPTCASSSQTFVTDPSGVKTAYTFGNDYINNFGQLLSTKIEKAGTIYRSDTYNYVASAQGQAFPDFIVESYNWRTNKFMLKFRPLRQRQTVQQGITFTWQANTFDLYANPLKIARSNTLGYSRTDVVAYHHNTALWVIGQPASSTNTDTGLIESKTDYDANALPWKTYAFGKLQQTLTYDTISGVATGQRGTLKTVADGNNHATTFSHWKRGIPQKIAFADGNAKWAQVNDLGGLDWVQDESGAKTCYGYDAMGRVNLITHPSETQAWQCNQDKWLATAITFSPQPNAMYGLSPGYWMRHEATGNARKVTFYDALWRPVVQETYDLANFSGTLSQTVTRYDAEGRPVFQAYPQRSQDPGIYNTWSNPTVAPNALGAWTSYDALGRPIRVDQNSEKGVLTATTEYLSGFTTRTTNPRGIQTVTQYTAYDQPSTDTPSSVTVLSGVDTAATDIVRDLFGKPQQIKRRNENSTVSSSRYYVYDGYQQLCKTIEPESGATAMGYDAAGNLAWSASGLNLPNPASCDAALVPAGSLVNRSYDARNRLSTLAFPDGRGNQIWAYTPDGLPDTITAYNEPGQTAPVVTAYHYNKRRLLDGQGETVTQPNWYTWGVGYGYDGYGHLSVQTYPVGDAVSYAPNALGQATQVAGSGLIFANSITYHPNGAIKQFTYGNGIVHTMTQNARQLPLISYDSSGALHHQYSYDNNGNVTQILDLNRGDHYSRWMGYDGLDRLLTTASCSFGPNCQFQYAYDALDNLTRVRGPDGSDRYYCYDAHWQLTNLKTGSCANGASVVGLGYDARGNLSNKNGQAYDFDYGNRLRAVAGQQTYRYDGLGRRVSAVSASQSRVWQYSRSGQLMMGFVGPNNHSIQQYVYLAGSLIATVNRNWPGNAISSVSYQHTDALGTPVAETDQAGNVVQRSEYDPYGRLNNQPLTEGVGYTGHYQDATGMINMQARYFDPQIGRFLSMDPITAYGSGDWRHYNPYVYAFNNPYKFKDPDGRAACSDEHQTCGYGSGRRPLSGLSTSFISPIDMGAVAFREQNYTTKPGVTLSQPTSINVGNLADSYNKATGKKLVVTDGSRTAQDQASRMHYKIANGEGIRLYANQAAANEVLNAYNSAIGANLARNDVISNMAIVISDQMTRGVYISDHLRDGAVDFRSRGLTGSDRQAFRDAAGSYKVILEGVPPHFHVEF